MFNIENRKKIIFDRFHIAKLMNQTLDEIRRALCHDETFLNDRDLIKGIRWLLLKNNKNLNDEKKERERLEQLDGSSNWYPQLV